MLKLKNSHNIHTKISIGIIIVCRNDNELPFSFSETKINTEKLETV